ncbi:GumC family protein [Roseovarius sp. 2305UL8-3]|uniref:GumC family protein n=1 Tax=Roseovarius conchicola TaxID=3121636 RepID=UPI003526CFC8
MEQFFSLDDMIDMIKRRFNVIAAVTVLGTVGALFYAISQTHLYESSEVIQVARPTIDNELARSTVDGSSARRLQLIEQQLMTRGTVLEIADQFDLFTDTPNMKLSERVSRVRDSVSIQGVAAAREGFTDDGTVSVLTITATFDTPEKAQGVAHEFAKRTIEISAASRIEQARETLRFFTEEESKLVADLEALEQELTNYRRENDLTLEGGLEFRQTQIASLNESIIAIEGERISLAQALSQLDQTQRASTLERQTRELEAQIQILDNQKALLEARVATLSAALETTPRVQRELGAFERRREKIQGELDVISTRRAEAEVGFKLEEQHQSERLTVIEPAALPDYPITPSRKRTALLGAMGSVFLGLLVAFLMDLRRPVIRSSRQMQAKVGITPVVTIPPLEPTRRNRKRLAGARIALAGYIHEARNRQAARKERG